jgi:hypothetical protein
MKTKQKCILFQFWTPDIPNQGNQQGWADLSVDSEGESVPCPSPSFWWLLAILELLG